jgi:hypothetical protein
MCEKLCGIALPGSEVLVELVILVVTLQNFLLMRRSSTQQYVNCDEGELLNSPRVPWGEREEVSRDTRMARVCAHTARRCTTAHSSPG